MTCSAFPKLKKSCFYFVSISSTSKVLGVWLHPKVKRVNKEKGVGVGLESCLGVFSLFNPGPTKCPGLNKCPMLHLRKDFVYVVFMTERMFKEHLQHVDQTQYTIKKQVLCLVCMSSWVPWVHTVFLSPRLNHP